jgi:3-hydroxyisobutyrate dehydrogenase-like beta-hydroxyacid dehydrogenase
MQTVGFIGLGQMGGTMAARFLAEGHTVYGTAQQGTRHTSASTARDSYSSSPST